MLGSTETQVDKTTDLRQLYEQLDWGDCWDDACMRDVVRYLRGSKCVSVPDSWRALLPQNL